MGTEGGSFRREVIILDFRLTEEQLHWQAIARKFADEEIRPVVAELDGRDDPDERFSWDLVKKASELGFRTFTIPKKWGGWESDLCTQAIVCEELGTGDRGFAGQLGANMKNALYLSTLLNDKQQAEFIPAYVNDDTYLLAIGTTEPESGTDVLLPYNEPGVAMKTTARREGDEYILNGVKSYVSNGGVAKLYFIYARTNEAAPVSKATSLFLVPEGTPGFSIGRRYNELGIRLASRAELVLKDVRIPACYLAGKENEALGAQRSMLAVSMVNTISAAIGEARRCYEETLAYAKRRVQGGKPIIEHVTIGTRIADMYLLIEAARSLVWKAAWSYDSRYEGYDPKLIPLVKAYVNELSIKVIQNAMEVFAGLGVQRKECSVERYLRNAYTMLPAGGTPTVNRIKAMHMLCDET
jgi:alkylation response protein AidB-like acyl-CoA dehydrogenase